MNEVHFCNKRIFVAHGQPPRPTAHNLATAALPALARPKIQLAKKVNVIHDPDLRWLWDECGLLNLEGDSRRRLKGNRGYSV
jgi:hypothetical protein